MEVNPTEGSNIWGEHFARLRERGIEQIDLIIADGLTGFADKAKKYFACDIQRCVVHLQRSLLNKVRPKDKASFGYDLKDAFNNFDNNSSIDSAMKKLQRLVNKWDMYKLDRLTNEEFIIDYLTYINYPTEVRRMIYTTNSIENLNRQIRKVTKTKVTFDKESNLLDLLFMIIKDFECNNWQKYPVITYQYWPRKTQSI